MKGASRDVRDAARGARFRNRETYEIVGWETGKSGCILRYISRKSIVMNAIERMQKN